MMKHTLTLLTVMFLCAWGNLQAQEWESEHFKFRLKDSTLLYSQDAIISPNNLDSLLAQMKNNIGTVYPPLLKDSNQRDEEKMRIMNEWYYSVANPRVIPQTVKDVLLEFWEENNPDFHIELLVDSTGDIIASQIHIHRLVLQKLADEQLNELYDNIMALDSLPFMKYYRLEKLPYTEEEDKQVDEFWKECVKKYDKGVFQWTPAYFHELVEKELGIKRRYSQYVWVELPYLKEEDLTPCPSK